MRRELAPTLHPANDTVMMETKSLRGDAGRGNRRRGNRNLQTSRSKSSKREFLKTKFISKYLFKIFFKYHEEQVTHQMK